MCLGQQYALTEAAYVTTRLVQRFEGVEGDGREWRENVGLTTHNGNGTRVVLTPV